MVNIEEVSPADPQPLPRSSALCCTLAFSVRCGQARFFRPSRAVVAGDYFVIHDSAWKRFPKDAQAHLGHRDIRTTMNTYTQVIAASVREMVQADEAAILGRKPPPKSNCPQLQDRHIHWEPHEYWRGRRGSNPRPLP